MREDIHFEEAPLCAIGKSRISGQGLFALKNFRPGEVVCNYSKGAKSWKKCKFTEIPNAYKKSCWWVGKSTRIALLASPKSSFMRANHSRTPNTLWDPKKMKLTAITNINCGEEITYDYRKEIAPKSLKANPPSWA